MTKSRKFNKAYSSELLSIASQDLETARLLMGTNLKRKENILFHIEQSIEKAIKAVLCKLEIAVPLVHEIAILIDRLPEEKMPPRSEDLADLTQFATIRRYEEGKATLTKEEIQEAYKLANEIIIWARNLI
jgi:HEPN domain-containing protein